MTSLLARGAAATSATVLLALAVTPAMAAPAPARAPVPIGHRQFFEGLVNKHDVHASLHVACAGPSSTGHPRRGQTVEVEMVVPPTVADQGYTGARARRIRAWLAWPAAAAAAPVHVATFTRYGVALRIPASLTVPCSGTGRMVFVPAPGSKSARRAFVKIAFKSNGA
jgi:hypothetical protein